MLSLLQGHWGELQQIYSSFILRENEDNLGDADVGDSEMGDSDFWECKVTTLP